MPVANVTQWCRIRSAMWRTIVRHLLLHIGVILGACSGLCWAGAVRAWCEPGRAAARRAGPLGAAPALRAAQAALPAAAAALALAAHLAAAAAAASPTTARRVHRRTTTCRNILLVLVALVCSGLVAAALAGGAWARRRAAAAGGADGGADGGAESGGALAAAAAAAADLLDVMRLLLRVCAKHHLLPDDIDLIIEETIEEFYEWIYAVCAIAVLTMVFLVTAASAAIALLCSGNTAAGTAELNAPTSLHISSHTPNILYEEKPLWEKKSGLRVEEARG